MKRAIGLDLGSKTLGVAQSDLMKMIASPVEVFRFAEDDYESALEYTSKFIKLNNVDEVVLGLPKHMNGDVGIRAQISIDFKESLEKMNDVKVILWDERLTSVTANKILIEGNMSREKRRKVVDKMAAVVILQGYLDSK